MGLFNVVGGVLAGIGRVPFASTAAGFFPPVRRGLQAARQRTDWTELARGVPSKPKKNGLGKFPQDQFDWDKNFKQAYGK